MRPEHTEATGAVCYVDDKVQEALQLHCDGSTKKHEALLPKLLSISLAAFSFGGVRRILCAEAVHILNVHMSACAQRFKKRLDALDGLSIR